MTLDFSDGPVSTLVTSLDRSARQIDQTFASAGLRLGEGLTIFEALNQHLTGLSGELVGRDMDATRDALLGVVDDLRSFSSDLPVETKLLGDIAAEGVVASHGFSKLLGHIRLVTVLARSARIEAAQVPSSQAGLSHFCDEIVDLIEHARGTIEACIRDQDRLKRLLASAVSRQHEFQATYGGTLVALAGKLEGTLGKIEDSRRKSLALTDTAAGQARAITGAVSNAIVALQSGDSIRQRLEHALHGLEAAREAGEGPESAWAGWDAGDRTALVSVLRRVVALQLGETAATLIRNVREIDRSLGLLGEDAVSTIELSRSHYGADNPREASVLAVLEAELAQASALIGRSNVARAVVDEVTATLTTFLGLFQQTADTLSETIGTIVMIGMNAGLRASRLGQDGRGLVIIAHELKAVSDQISDDAKGLAPAFDTMQAATAALTTRRPGGPGRLAVLDETIKRSLHHMRGGSKRLADTLDQLVHDGARFAAIIDDARLLFSNAGATSDAILGAGEVLDEGEDAPIAAVGGADAERVGAFLAGRIRPTYTMAAERQLHDAVLDRCGLTGADGALAVAGPEPSADLEDFLF